MRRSTLPFGNRAEAGRRLAARVGDMAAEDLVVLALPRGGVPVAYEVAAALQAPLDLIVVRKLGVPFQPELAMGAIGEDGARVINDEVMEMARITPRQLADVEGRERAELERRAARFRQGRPRLDLAGRTALVVDDGVATGSTAKAACLVAREHGARRVVLAVPVAPSDAASRFVGHVDEFVALETPEPFFGVGQFYSDFSQTSDEEVVELLSRAARARADSPTRDRQGVAADPITEEVQIPTGGVELAGQLDVPPRSLGVVVFAHGSGSSRHSSRNRFVASVLNDAGIGTLLFDLLTSQEELDRANVFDVALLAGRLSDVTAWLRAQRPLSGLPLGYFGASTGAAAALWAAAEPGADVAALVSRGGRPDLAMPRLAAVSAPTLLIVGGDDRAVLGLNQEAAAELRCEHELAVVAGATHLFEEPGALAQVAQLAGRWFESHFLP